MTLELLDSYDKVIFMYSGGKDSTADVLYLKDLGVPIEKMELWHHDIDGRSGQFMDWPVTPAYCEAFAKAMGIPIYFSWRSGEFPAGLNHVGNGSVVNDTLLAFTSTLAGNTEYWWKIKAIGSLETVWSGLWHFTTGTPGLAPTAVFSADLLSGETPLTVTFTDLSEGSPNIWEWDFENDGSIDSYEQNPQHEYAVAGDYSVSLTVSNTSGADTEIKESYITVTSPGNTFTVKLDGTGDYSSIQAAIDGVSDGQVVVVYPGTYIENIDFNGKAIIVESLFSSTQDEAYVDQTIINGGGNSNVVRINSGEGTNTELTGFTITNGSSPNSGGGIMMYGTSPVISHCKIVNNDAVNFGGGIACLQNANPFLHHLEVLGNTSTEGGGINVYLSTPQLENILVANNSAGEMGGGVALSSCSELLINNLTITENTAPWGGGLFITSSQLIINNTILWRNEPQEVYFNYYYELNQVDIAYSDIDGGEAGFVVQNGTLNMGSGNISSNPLFGDGFRLNQLSPCIDAGDPEAALDPDNTSADMGAFSFDPNYVSIQSTTKPIDSFVLVQNFPNPFNPSTTIRYGLPNRSMVSVVIYDVSGKVVRTFHPELKSAGWHEQVWKGKDNGDETIGTGIYFARLTTGEHTQTIKMLYLK